MTDDRHCHCHCHRSRIITIGRYPQTFHISPQNRRRATPTACLRTYAESKCMHMREQLNTPSISSPPSKTSSKKSSTAEASPDTRWYTGRLAVRCWLAHAIQASIAVCFDFFDISFFLCVSVANGGGLAAGGGWSGAGEKKRRRVEK